MLPGELLSRSGLATGPGSYRGRAGNGYESGGTAEADRDGKPRATANIR